MNILHSFACLIAVAVTAFAAPEKKAPVDPAKLQDKVSITPGKKAVVQFQQDGNALSKLKVVEKADEKTPAVNLDFHQDEKLMFLSVQNGFPKTLKFRALMRLKGRKDYVETSILPVLAGLASFES